MSHIYNDQIIHCPFPFPIPKTKFYTCYKKETCCEQGCCLNGPYQIYQIWYYWLLFLIVFGIISGASWLCKKPRTVQARTVREVAASSHTTCGYPNFRCNRRRCTTTLDRPIRIGCHNVPLINNTVSNSNNNTVRDYEDSIVLDRLFVSFKNRNTLGDPPSYSSIISPDCSKASSYKFCPLYSYYGPPPAYNSMYKTNEVQLTNSNNTLPNYESVVSASANETQIEIHSDDLNRTNDEMESGNRNSRTNVNIPTTSYVDNNNETEITAPVKGKRENNAQNNGTQDNS